MKTQPACAALAVLLGLAACKPKPEPPPPPAPPTQPEAGPGLPAADRAVFYHLAEGSEIIPLAWMKALRDPATNRPVLENPERFGMIADPGNPDGLPVGGTADVTVDTRFAGVRMFGFNCAACHVNEVTWRGQRVRIDGGPARFDGEALMRGLLAAVEHTITHWPTFLQFVKDLDRIEHAATRAGPPAPGAPAQPPPDSLAAALTDADSTAAEAALIAEVRRALRRDSLATPAVDLMNVPFDSAAPGFRTLQTRYSEAAVAPRAAEAVRSARTRSGPPAAGAPPSPAAAPSAQQSVQKWILVLRLLRDRRETLSLGLMIPGAMSPGRVDAFGVARNRIFTRNRVPTTAQVSFPHLWGFGQVPWLHYDNNTNTVMERNLGQALGVGAVWDRTTFQSTLNPGNIHRLETVARRIPVPAWPAAFPRIDPARAAQGAALYGAQCAACHADRPTRDLCYPLDRIGTDPNRAAIFATPLNGGTFTAAVAPVLHRLKAEAYRTFEVPASEQPAMDGIPDSQVVWRTTRAYGARPLAGVWATAPYLHNGSVPNLYELLSPPARRRKTFPVGHPGYDPDSVGIALTAPQGTKTFDTRQPGNGNGGHVYGTTLSEPERLALLEYLKGYRGGYSGPVTPNNDGIPCPSLR